MEEVYLLNDPYSYLLEELLSRINHARPTDFTSP